MIPDFAGSNFKYIANVLVFWKKERNFNGIAGWKSSKWFETRAIMQWDDNNKYQLIITQKRDMQM